MRLDEATQQGLKELLRDCTVNVQVDGASKGTAFFLSNTLLLTCHHVVKERDEVDLVPRGRPLRSASVVRPNPGEPFDLALLRVDVLDEEDAAPAVLLQTPTLTEGEYFIAGFPREQGEEAGLEAFTVTGHRRERQDGSVEVLELQAGKQITFGMSGGPVMSLEHGAVVGVTRKSKDTEAALGGGAIPMAKAAEAYPEVAQLLSDPPIAVRRWRDCLGPTLWQLVTALPWEMSTHIDLMLTGSRNKWCIKSEVTPGEGELLSAPDLGDDLTDAMFRWAQRRRLNGRAEVNLLGRLLAKALFPTAVSSQLRLLGHADQVTVRLHIGQDRELADIPWEFASVPDRAEAFLAADPDFRFVRINDQATRRPLPQAGSSINVLGVIGLPEQWEFPELRYGESRYTWPKTTAITRGLGSHFAANPYAFKPMVNPTISELRKELEEGSYDVLHYIGVGHESATGSARLWLVEPLEQEPVSHDVHEVLEAAASSGVKVTVLEFTGPPVGQRLEPVSPGSLGNLAEVLDGSLVGLVLTRFPVHPQQFQLFNQGFYESLRRGEPLPQAVQEGRRQLRETPALEDAAGFGCFTLITGPNSELRLVSARAGGAAERSPRTQVSETDEQSVTETGVGPSLTGDEFIGGRR